MSISVIIPVYNAAKYVKEAVNSVLKLKEVFEIILIEDGSKDSSYELCLEMSTNHDKIILLSHPNNGNKGPSASRNRGIEEARGELIAFLDADDYYLSNRFENALDYFSKSKEIDMIYESILFKSGNDKDVSKIYFDANSNHFEEYFLGHKGWLHLNGITFRKRVFEKIGLFDLDLRLTQDTDLILRSFINVTFHGINKEPVAV